MHQVQGLMALIIKGPFGEAVGHETQSKTKGAARAIHLGSRRVGGRVVGECRTGQRSATARKRGMKEFVWQGKLAASRRGRLPRQRQVRGGAAESKGSVRCLHSGAGGRCPLPGGAGGPLSHGAAGGAIALYACAWKAAGLGLA